MATSPLFGWEEPDDVDLVKDGAAAIRTLGNAIDTSMGDLLGGTTGQVLSKASNTNMDFVWTAATSGDITGVSVTSPITGGGTSGDVTIGISSSAVVPSQTGNSGKYLTTDGTNSSWGTISAGGMTLIATATPSAASTFSFTSIASTYKHLLVVIPELVWSTTNQHAKMRFATGNYYSTRAMGTWGNSGTFSYATERGESYFGNGSDYTCPIQKGYTSSGTFGDISSATSIWIYNYTATNDRLVTWQAAGNGGLFTATGIYDHNAAIDNITFQTQAGTVTGTAYLYGVS